MQPYDHKRIERKWQSVWSKTKLYRTDGGAGQRSTVNGEKSYVLDMFPYPSGDGLHVGHPKGYIATDVFSRYNRMQGKQILHPMGWDAFGLPAENYAIANKIHPELAVKKNIKRFKKQLGLLGFDYDWEREINTTDPHYYKWTQWIFLQMFHHGLAFRSNEPINWCPSCKTGLANEDLEDGKCERCSSVVEKKALPQWVLKITDYADRLLSGLDTLSWPEYIKESQRNWIGRSEGAEIRFKIQDSGFKNKKEITEIKVFTTRIDTIFSGTFVVLAPEHPLLKNIESGIVNIGEIRKYQDEARQKTEIERTDKSNKTGVELKGVTAINPSTGESIPIWVSDFVLGEYGTGAVFADAHDRRDFDMAKTYGIPLKVSILPPEPELAEKVKRLEECFEGEGILFNSGPFDGLSSKEARPKIVAWLQEKGHATSTVKYRLKDWVFSRQRYWGEPIPLVFCEACKKQVDVHKTQTAQKAKQSTKHKFSKGELQNPGWIGVDEKKLPVKLPKVESYEPTGTGESPLAKIEKWVNVKCPKCKGPAKRETNTMPQWAGSCWYYIAYCIRENHKSQNTKTKQFPNLKSQKTKRILQKWLPVDMYVGGAEHATRHLIYARFWHKFLFDIGVVETDEPFQKLQNVGLILASDGRKMSKRFGNVVNPDEIVERFGADSLRVYEMFMGPFNQAISWNTDALVGTHRFLEKILRLHLNVEKKKSTASNPVLSTLLHQTIKKVGEDIIGFKFNTAISALMILTNALEKEPVLPPKTLAVLITLLAPFAPHIAEELWQKLGHKKSVHLEPWPVYDTSAIKSLLVTIVVQINGKVRGSFEAGRNATEESLKETAFSLPTIRKWMEGKETKKVIIVPNRLINVVVV
ncbi:MAG: leucine--tRNA ligase [bacterium]|nr:leucine--tRNA ligase [bacterium]